MISSTERVSVEALSLPRKARAELAERLLTSLEDEETTTEIEAAWQSEIQRRRADYAAGTAKTRPAAEVMHDAVATTRTNRPYRLS